MRNVILTLTLLITVSVLVACGGGSETSGNASGSEDAKEKPVQQEQETSNQVFENDDYKFTFGEGEMLEGKYGDAVLAIPIEFTNKTDEAESPWMASIGTLNMKEVGETTTNSVIGGNGQLPEDYKPEYYRMDEQINGGETVKAIFALTIQNPGSEIKISEGTMPDENPSFERTYQTSQSSQ